jgi:hypothetical protein
LVFVARGQNPFRLATLVPPRTVVCAIGPQEGASAKISCNGRGEKRVVTEFGDLEAFPYPLRVVHVDFRGKNRIAIFPNLATGTDATASLAAWLKSLGREVVAIPRTRISSHNHYTRVIEVESVAC